MKNCSHRSQSLKKRMRKMKQQNPDLWNDFKRCNRNRVMKEPDQEKGAKKGALGNPLAPGRAKNLGGKTKGKAKVKEKTRVKASGRKAAQERDAKSANSVGGEIVLRK